MKLLHFPVLFLFLFFTSNVFAQPHTEPSHFLVASDIHFDPFNGCGATEKPCAEVEALRKATPDQWSNILAQYDTQPAVSGKDTNYPLLSSALNQLNKTASANNVQFVLLLGDFLAHKYKKQFQLYSSDSSSAAYSDFVKKTLAFLTLEFSQAFPNVDVYSVVGNNDSYVDDYVSEPNGAFFQDTAATWSQLIKDSNNQSAMKQQFSVAGYYAVNQNNLRIIVLNTSLFSNKASGVDVDQAAQDELTWLNQQLADANTKNQKVLFAMHIPDSVDTFSSLNASPYQIIEFWKPQYTQIFQADLKQYANEIVAILPGHLHTDWFQILSTTIPVIGTPAISPQFGNNPGFKVYDFDSASLSLTNYTTYFYDLNSARVWNKEYDFNSVYQPGCTNCKVIDGLSIPATGSVAQSYQTYYALGTNSQPITSGKWAPYYWCSIYNATKDDYQNCIASQK